MNYKTKKILKISSIVLLILILNTATIFYFGANFQKVSWTPDKGINFIEESYWDSITNKEIAKRIWGNAYKDFYHFYNKPLVYFFMFIGWLLTIGLLIKINDRNNENKRFEKLAEQISNRPQLSAEEKQQQKTMKKIKNKLK